MKVKNGIRTGSYTDPIFAPFQVKQLDENARTFEGLSSTWQLDLGDDVIHRGAFKNWLADWRKSGRTLPLIDQHNYGSVRSVVGKLLDAKETKDGLWTKWEIIEGEDGDEILRRLKGGYIDGLSIGYRPLKYDFEDSEDARFGQIRHLREVELLEVSLVIWPMNEGARIDFSSVKALMCRQDLTDEEKKEVVALHERIEARLAEQDDDDDVRQPDPPKTGEEKPEDDGAPDTSLFDRLQLQRLGWRPTHTQEV